MYEHETYTEARKNLPKRNKRVLTPIGEGKVVDVVPLREVVIVEIPDVGKREFPSDKIKLVDENQS
jgi:cell fate regulator YaaT (PSP1 superfamily)